MGKVKDITGMRFGNLIAVKDTGKSDANRNRIWLCQCDCGSPLCEVSGNNLRTGHTKSCGCLKQIKCAEIGKKQNIIDEIGNVYGKLTVISMEKVDNHCAFWNCKCECGNEIIVAGNHLRTGHTTSCGCVKSVGEMRINQILSQTEMNYSTQYTIFIDDAYYRFDYAIFDNQHQLIRLVEFDGEQHYHQSHFYDYERTHRNDLRKNQYCKDNNIPLVRIPYWERNNISLDLILGDKYLI
jgi:hypothetical protein